jgi:hypothetical protein
LLFPATAPPTEQDVRMLNRYVNYFAEAFPRMDGKACD